MNRTQAVAAEAAAIRDATASEREAKLTDPATYAGLANWPPCRGPRPKDTDRRLLRWRKPTIELLPDGTKSPTPTPFPRTAQKDGRRPRSFRMGLDCYVSDVAKLPVNTADNLLTGAVVENRGKKPYACAGRFLTVGTYVVDIDYPLSRVARVTVYPMRRLRIAADGTVKYDEEDVTVGYLLAMLARSYRRIYAEWEKWGVWGHAIGDLCFEGLHFRDNVVSVDIGS